MTSRRKAREARASKLPSSPLPLTGEGRGEGAEHSAQFFAFWSRTSLRFARDALEALAGMIPAIVGPELRRNLNDRHFCCLLPKSTLHRAGDLTDSSADAGCREAPSSRFLLCADRRCRCPVPLLANARLPIPRLKASPAAGRATDQSLYATAGPYRRAPARRSSPAINKPPSSTSRRWRATSHAPHRLQVTPAVPSTTKLHRAVVRPMPGVRSVIWV